MNDNINKIINRLETYNLMISCRGEVGLSVIYDITGKLNNENISANINHYNTGKIIVQGVDSSKVSALIDDLLS
ncbi:hypothetical protein [Campylobacter jejuni]|uniref:Uncharacterized protein n=1 Tax=Campylobacter jejuni TaxID=197 RepID=A0A431D263_CAMJU|nr:hypothetical protein [Campylobacter jejuni]ECL9136698.1 hypothetical protein [Campylobacter jejuni]RTJ61638.1 hypothetical protein C3H66_03400 [Campylobacter jejuni]RTJ95716.1 hypothetical protein C3H42_04500 [Campylobacter jejuni]RTK05896.1 hypothetical protein C3H39_02945 [Campylobacter jejuni]HDZ4273784.1 hypothetical protein [Campylobacter jejuni]